MLEQQIADLRKYFATLNYPEQRVFIENLRVKIDKESDIRVVNQLRKLKNECVAKYNAETLKRGARK